MSRRPHVVIVGAGFGGLKAARRLRRLPVDVTVIDRRNYQLFQPLLYQVAIAALAPNQITAPIRPSLRNARNTRVLLGDVTGIDLDRRLVHVAHERSIPFDYLILAAGSVPSYFGHEEWREHAPTLKSIEQALDIRRRILLAFEAAELEPDPERRRMWTTFALIGGGPTGVELAGALSELSSKAMEGEFRNFDPRSTRVVLVEAMDRILPGLHPKLSRMARRELERRGIEIQTGQKVTGVDALGVTFGEGMRLDAKTIIWTAGVAVSPLAKELGAALDKKGKVLVEGDLSLPGHSNVFVIGDMVHWEQNGRPVADVAQKALQMAEHATRMIRRDLRSRRRSRFRYRDKGYMAVIGRNAAVADLRFIKLSGTPAWFAWTLVHLIWLVGFRNRITVLADWFWTYITNRRAARIIIPSARPETRALGREEQMSLNDSRLGAPGQAPPDRSQEQYIKPRSKPTGLPLDRPSLD